MIPGLPIWMALSGLFSGALGVGQDYRDPTRYRLSDTPILDDFCRYAQGHSVFVFDDWATRGIVQPVTSWRASLDWSCSAGKAKELINDYRTMAAIDIQDLDANGSIKLPFKVKYVSAKAPKTFGYWASQFKGDKLSATAFRSFEHKKYWPKGKLAKRIAYFPMPWFDKKGRRSLGLILVADPQTELRSMQDIFSYKVVCVFPSMLMAGAEFGR